jgi:L-arabinonolactonase
MSRIVTATRISPSPDLLGESPVWDAQERRLLWVDSVSRLIRAYDPATGETRETATPSMVGSIGLATGGRVVAGLADSIATIDLATGSCDPLLRLDPPDPNVRFNDGKVDREGRFVCGTMGIHAEPRGELRRVGADGRSRILANGVRISNSLCFSPDGRTMYFADSLDRAVRAYRYSADDDSPVDEPRVFVDTSAFGSGPDGATVDADGCVWVALVLVGRIARFTPAGVLDRLVEAPTDMPSCMAFGGSDFSTLYVTSIKDSGTGRAISRHPAGGHVFAIEGLGVAGLPEPRFGLGGSA